MNFDLCNNLIVFGLVVANLLLIILVIKRQNRKLRKENITDELTGTHNYRYLNERLKEELSRAYRLKYTVQVLFGDLNNFKAMNDCLGHDVGDEMLIETFEILKNNLRKHDIFGRWYNGDEFLVILPETDKTHAKNVINRLSLDIAVAGKKIAGNKELRNGSGKKVEVSISIGMSSFNPNDLNCKDIDTETLINKADADMYRQKKEKKLR